MSKEAEKEQPKGSKMTSKIRIAKYTLNLVTKKSISLPFVSSLPFLLLYFAIHTTMWATYFISLVVICQQFILILLMVTQAVYANIQSPDYIVKLKMTQYF